MKHYFVWTLFLGGKNIFIFQRSIITTICFFWKVEFKRTAAENQKSNAYALGVQVVHSPGDGAQHGAGLSFWETLLPKNAVQELASPHQLHHQVHIFPIIIDLEE